MITMKKSTNLLITAICFTIAFILEGIGLIRYLSRLPDDWVGIGLYIAVIVGFTVAATGFFIQWKKEKHKDE